jgi:endogenous inhibitor of DNA gyrase (YacG/DUF329 family)
VCGKEKTKKTKFCCTRCGQIYIKRLKRKAKKHPELLEQYINSVERSRVYKKIAILIERLKRKIRYGIKKLIKMKIRNKKRGRWKRCKKCKEKFWANGNMKKFKKFCSPKCKISYRNARAKKRRTKCEKRKIQRKERKRERYLKLWYYENCEWCGRLFFIEHARDVAFCSRKCANLYWENLEIIKKVRGEE